MLETGRKSEHKHKQLDNLAMHKSFKKGQMGMPNKIISEVKS